MRPKVLHVVEAVEGGVARYVADLVTCVRDVDHVVAMPVRRSVGVTDESAIARIEAGAKRVHRVDMRREPIRPANAAAIRQIRVVIKEEPPDIVHGHSTIGGLIARLSGGKRPVVYTPNALFPGAAVTAIERALGRRTTALVAVSPSEAAEFRRRRLVPAERVHVIPTGLPPAEGIAPFVLRDRIGVTSDAPIVATAVRLVPQKDPETFVRAMNEVLAAHPEAQAVVFGDGPLLPALQSLAGDRVHLLGHVPEARSLFAQVDVFVLSSRYEGLPYALLEAMQAGVAVVATDVVGSRDAIRNADTGLLVPQGDVGSLADAVGRLLGDPTLRTQFAAAGQRLVASEFTVEQMEAGYQALYERLASAAR